MNRFYLTGGSGVTIGRYGYCGRFMVRFRLLMNVWQYTIFADDCTVPLWETGEGLDAVCDSCATWNHFTGALAQANDDLMYLLYQDSLIGIDGPRTTEGSIRIALDCER